MLIPMKKRWLYVLIPAAVILTLLAFVAIFTEPPKPAPCNQDFSIVCPKFTTPQESNRTANTQ